MATKENPGALAGATEAKGRLSKTEYTVPPPRWQPAPPTFDAAEFPIIARHWPNFGDRTDHLVAP